MTAPQRPQILVVEDDRVVQELVAELLQEAGYAVITANDGDEALKAVRERAPDLVLLDVSMPRLDGYSVCRAIQASVPAPPPVIFVTAHGNVEDRVLGLDMGAVDFLVKPFNPPELEARVRAALRTKATVDTLTADASTDPLTGLLSQSQVARRAEAAVTLARSHARPLACLILGVEGLDETAARFGAPAAAAALREVARRVQRISRRSDVLARYGQTSILILLPETDAPSAVAAADRIRQALDGDPVPLPEASPPVRVTVSAGVAAWTPELADADAFLRVAQGALARARAQGPGHTVRVT